MGNKISKADGNIIIGIVNSSLPEKRHIDYNINNPQESPQNSDIVSEITTTSILSQKNSIEELIYEDESDRAYIKVKDLIDFNVVNLCSRKIIKISPNAFHSTTLSKLNLCCNYLKEIPDSIGLLVNLRLLNLSNNSLTSLPNSIGMLKKLDTFIVAFNRINYLPIEMKNLKKLKTLNLRNNNIMELPQELKELKNLITLDVSSNQIVSIPAEICNIKTLQKILINNCPLIYSSCVPSLSKEVPSLKELASRIIIRRNIPITDDLSDELKYYLGSVHQCSFCHGPFFETYEKRNQLIRRNEVNIPLEYKLCISHWSSEEERIKVLFSRLPYTSPQPINKNDSNITNTTFSESNVKGLKSKSTVGNDTNKPRNRLVKSKSSILLSTKSDSKSKLNSSTNTLSSLISSPSIDNYYQVDNKTSELTFSNELLNLGSSTNLQYSALKHSYSSTSLSNQKIKRDSSFLSLFTLKK